MSVPGEKRKNLSVSHSSWSLLCCRSGISSTSVAEKEKTSDELLSKTSTTSVLAKKPGGWKAMPFILGLILFLLLAIIFNKRKFNYYY